MKLPQLSLPGKLMLIAVCLIFCGAIALTQYEVLPAPPLSEDVEGTIAGLKDRHYQNYFIKQIDYLYKKEGIHGMVKRVVTALETKQIGMFECHSLAHDIGHYAGYADHFESIAENLSKENLDFCGSGFMHGVEGQLANESYPENTEKLYYFCGLVRPYEPYYGGCYHGAGHAFMENIHDVPTALSECDTLKTGEYTKDVTDCYRGVFSENADVVIADGGKTSDLLAFCSSLEERLQVYCAMELNGLHVGHGASAADIEKGFAQCVEDAYADVIKEGCIRSVTWVITDNILSAQHDLTPSAFVQTLPDSLRLVYIEATYGSFLKTAAYRKDLSFDSFCSLLSDPGDKDFCHSLPTRMSGGA